jgi:hypothetical protein
MIKGDGESREYDVCFSYAQIILQLAMYARKLLQGDSRSLIYLSNNYDTKPSWDAFFQQRTAINKTITLSLRASD